MRKLWNEHPNLVSWAAVAVGMVAIVVIAARNVGFQPGQWAAIIAATTPGRALRLDHQLGR